MSEIDTVSARVGQPVAPIGLTPEALFEKCNALARNLWWSWQPEVINLFRDLDPIRWRQLDHNPIALLSEFTPERLEMRAAELVLFSRINHAYRRLKEYLVETPLWAKTHAGVLGSKPVAYFSLEFGVHESLPIYAGGLGILAGDHAKTASDIALPLVGVGLFYHQGYFRQEMDARGRQRVVFPRMGPVQSAEQVARAIVRCVKRPRAEVYPYWPVRLLAVLSAAAPGLVDRVMARLQR